MTRWALVLGKRGAPKAVAAVVESLRERGLGVAGVVQEARGAEAERAYVARRIGRGDVAALARSGGGARPNEQEFCSFLFDRDGFAAARRWLAEDATGADVVVLDEVSKLEVAGGGHEAALRDALGRGGVLVLAVRADQLFAVMERFGLEPPLATLEGSDEGDRRAFVDAVFTAARGGAP